LARADSHGPPELAILKIVLLTSAVIFLEGHRCR
jgi:hypothetical protein